MKLSKLYIKNFICHDESIIDFSLFKSALVVGKRSDNDMFANGVGKTTIFKAIEFVLFNHSDDKFERIVRDDTDYCKVILDFIENDEEYRIIRHRTRKGSSDIWFLKRNNVEGSDSEVFKYPFESKYWIDLTGRRSSDTEKEISKIIKFNLKSFRNTVHFVQKDTSGLATTTAEKRKGILKEALNLSIYQKLEKIAKEQASLLSKNIEKNELLISSFKESFKDVEAIKSNISNISLNIANNEEKIKEIDFNIEINEKSFQSSNETFLKRNEVFNSLMSLTNSINNELVKNNKFVTDYKNKKNSSIKEAKFLIEEVNKLKENSIELSKIDYDVINSIENDVLELKNKIFANNANIKATKEKIEELSIPMPTDAVCKHCRQSLSEEHKSVCQAQIKEEIQSCKNIINSLTEANSNNNKLILEKQSSLNDLKSKQKKIEVINSDIISKNKEIASKQSLYKEYGELITKFENEAAIKTEELSVANAKLAEFNQDELKKLQNELNSFKQIKLSLLEKKSSITKLINSFSNEIAVMNHSLEIDKQNREKCNNLSKELESLHKKYKVYDPVLKAFSSTGIPNIIIQNMLDGLQEEANLILSKLRPDIQLSFVVEKTKSDGTQDDTLDIIYYVNGRERTYSLLSGAMQMLVHFSLKLGLSFLLQKMMGTNIEFLLFDEIDPDLDKATVDAFSDIVKLFQKDFNILVITHNDRLKDKFENAILVEQDVNMVSKAKVVSEW